MPTLLSADSAAVCPRQRPRDLGRVREGASLLPRSWTGRQGKKAPGVEWLVLFPTDIPSPVLALLGPPMEKEDGNAPTVEVEIASGKRGERAAEVEKPRACVFFFFCGCGRRCLIFPTHYFFRFWLSVCGCVINRCAGALCCSVLVGCVSHDVCVFVYACQRQRV